MDLNFQDFPYYDVKKHIYHLDENNSTPLSREELLEQDYRSMCYSIRPNQLKEGDFIALPYPKSSWRREKNHLICRVVLVAHSFFYYRELTCLYDLGHIFNDDERDDCVLLRYHDLSDIQYHDSAIKQDMFGTPDVLIIKPKIDFFIESFYIRIPGKPAYVTCPIS